MLRWLTFALIALCAGPAFSQTYDREGFVLGGGFSYASENFDESGIDFDDTGAVDLLGGYRFNSIIGTELRFEQTFDFEGDTPGPDVDVDIWALTGNLQFYILTGQFQPYLGGGFGLGEADVEVHGPGGDDDFSDPVWRLFLGLDSYVNENIAIGAEVAYNFGVDDLNDFDYWTMSALFKYRF